MMSITNVNASSYVNRYLAAVLASAEEASFYLLLSCDMPLLHHLLILLTEHLGMRHWCFYSAWLKVVSWLG